MYILLLFMMWSLLIIVNALCYIVHWTRTSMYIGYWTLNKYYYYYYMSHTPPTHLTTLISSTSPVLDKTPEPRVPLIHALTATTPPPDPTLSLPLPSHHQTLTAHTYATQTTVHASQSPQQPPSHYRIPRQPHKQTKDYQHHTNTRTKQ